MVRFVKYLGDDHILGEIIKETHDGFYWLVRQMPDKKGKTKSKLVCHPKWCTQVIEEADIWKYTKQ